MFQGPDGFSIPYCVRDHSLSCRWESHRRRANSVANQGFGTQSRERAPGWGRSGREHDGFGQGQGNRGRDEGFGRRRGPRRRGGSQRGAVRAGAGLHPRRRQFAGAGLPFGRRHAPLHRPRPGSLRLGCRRPPLHRPGLFLGADDPRPRASGGARGGRKTARDGLSFGAPTEAEVDFAERLVRMLPSLQQVRLVSSGTEATMSAIRLARGFTGRSRLDQVRGLLSRPRRQPAGQGRLGRADVRQSELGRRAAGDHASTRWCSTTTTASSSKTPSTRAGQPRSPA